MTSSLVGSEMCIRDSSGCAYACSSSHHCNSSTKACRSCYAHAYVNIDEAVSYTHLTLPTICSV
eukprot:5122745-Prorocentrum_lima.AAC.1